MKTAALALALAATAYSQNLTQALGSQPDLTNLTTFLGPYLGQFAGLSNITLLAPNNDALTEFLNSSTAGAIATEPALVQAILSYHILNGTFQASDFSNATTFERTALQPGAYANVTGGQRVGVQGGGNVTFVSGLLQTVQVTNSTNFTGGVIHVIDHFLTLPQNVSASAIALNLTSAAGALTNLSLVNTVDTTPDLTLFVPDNEAFARIGGNLANLTRENLTNILEYHVVAGTPVGYSSGLANGTSLRALNGENLTITLEGEDVYVNNARVVIPNVLVRNGVIHVIDRVLNPANATAPINTATTEEAYPGATSASEQPFTSGVPTPTSAVDTASAASATSSGGAWRPIETGAIGMAALFGGAAAVMNM